MDTPLVFTVCGDAGGAGALVPVLLKLSAEGKVVLKSYAYLQSVEILARKGIAAVTIPANVDESWAESEIRRNNPALLLVATSQNDRNHEQDFLAAARRNRVPSLAVLDFWAAYRARFADAEGRLVYVPQRIAVMDSAARSGMIAAGLPEDIIVITGHPGFDELAAKNASFTAAQRAAVREKFGVQGRGPLVLFVSQPLREIYGGPSQPSYLGYDEHVVIDLVVQALETLALRTAVEPTLLIRPHPREQAQSYNALRSERVRVVVSRAGEAQVVALSADLVLGMTSMLLVEAAFLGCKVGSIQPRLRHPNVLPPEVCARLNAVFEPEHVGPMIERLLHEPFEPPAAELCSSRVRQPLATLRVVECAYSLLRR